jgi:hypothetical protein
MHRDTVGGNPLRLAQVIPSSRPLLQVFEKKMQMHLRIIVVVLALWLPFGSGFQLATARVPNPSCVAARHSSRIPAGHFRRGLPLLKMANIDAAPEVRPRPRAMRWTLANLSACLCTGVHAVC